MALSTPDRQSHPGGHRRVDSIDDVLHSELFVDDSCFVVGHMVAIEPSGNFLIDAGMGKQIAGKLFDRKLIKRHIRIESFDDPVSPQPHRSRFVAEVTVRVGVASKIQPFDRHVFAEMRRGQ